LVATSLEDVDETALGFRGGGSYQVTEYFSGTVALRTLPNELIGATALYWEIAIGGQAHLRVTPKLRVNLGLEFLNGGVTVAGDGGGRVVSGIGYSGRLGALLPSSGTNRSASLDWP
jgi:hypothetical protein